MNDNHTANKTSGALKRLAAGLALAVLALGISQPAAHANGTPHYFDVDGTTAGFGTPSGSYTTTMPDPGPSDPAYWSTDSAGSSAPVGFPANPGAMMVFGNTDTDFDGATFTINFGGDWFWLQGLAVNSTNANITLAGGSLINFYPDNPVTSWHVATGSTLNVTGNYGGIGGMNWGGYAVSFTGGGTFNFVTAVGLNAGGTTIIQSGPVVNLQAAVPAGTASWDKMAKYTLTAGTLNFATTDSAGAFNLYGNDDGTLTINGGTIDNTSGSAMSLDLQGGYAGQGIIKIGGDFTFAGSSDLSFGTAPVTLTATSQITVTNNLTIGGVISGSGFGLTKAGTGTLTLTGANSYSGNTTVSAGTLSIATAYLADASTVTIASSGATLNLNFSGTDSVVQLIIGGTAQPDGVYGAVGSGAQHEIAQITGTGTITVAAPVLSTACDILTFGANVLGSSVIITTTSSTAGTVAWTVPYGTTVADLAPTFTMSPDAMCNNQPNDGVTPPNPPLSTSTPVTYTVTAKAGNTKDYAVLVTVAAPALIYNGSFEIGVPAPPAPSGQLSIAAGQTDNLWRWTASTTMGHYFKASAWGMTAPDGGRLVNIYGITGVNTLSQSFAVLAGVEYTVSYFEMRRGGSGKMNATISVTAGTVTGAAGSPVAVSQPTSSSILQTTAINDDWTLHSFKFTPDANAQATFTVGNNYTGVDDGAHGDNDGIFVDKVSVTGETAVGTEVSTTTLARAGGTGTSSTYGDPLSFVVTVSGGAGNPTGTVFLKDGGSSGTVLGSGPLANSGPDGVRTITITTLTGGAHNNIVAVYRGDSTYNTSTSAALSTQTVNPAVPVVTVTGLTSFHYNGSEQGPNTANTGGSSGALSFSYAGTGSTTYGPIGTRPTDIGTYTATATVAAETVPPINYLGAASSPTAFTIGAALALPVITDVKLWLDASQLTGLNNNDPVTTWTDMSGWDNDAAKTGGSPKYITSGLNGKPVIRFNRAAGDAFTTADLSSQFPSAATVFIVTTINTGTPAYTLVYTSADNDEWWRYNDGNSYPAVFRSPRVEQYVAMPDSGSQLFAISSSSSAWEMWINGSSPGAAGGSYSAGGVHVIGAGSNGGTLDGDIAEVIEFSRALNATELTQMGSYLASKYGLTTAYPPIAVDYTATISLSGGGEDVDITFKTEVGFCYTLQYRVSLAPETWVDIIGGMTGTGNSEVLKDVGVVTATEPPNPQRFYRVKRVSGPCPL